jgi:hypothetical protein
MPAVAGRVVVYPLCLASIIIGVDASLKCQWFKSISNSFY